MSMENKENEVEKILCFNSSHHQVSLNQNETELIDIGHDNYKDIGIAMLDEKYIKKIKNQSFPPLDNGYSEKYENYCLKYGFDVNEVMYSQKGKEEFVNAYKVVNRWVKFSYENDICMFDFFNSHMRFQCEEFSHILLEECECDTLEDGFIQKYITAIKIELARILAEIVNVEELMQREVRMQGYKKSLDRSFEIATECINYISENPSQESEFFNSLPKVQDSKKKNKDYSVHEDIAFNKNRIEEVFESKRAFSNFLRDNHNLSKLKDDVGITSTGDMIYPSLIKGLVIGYTSKSLLVDVEKDSSIKQLKESIEVLNRYPSSGSGKLIYFTKEMIEFIEQKRNSRTIPFMIIGKYLGLTETEAFKYANKVLSVNETSFIANYKNAKQMPFFE